MCSRKRNDVCFTPDIMKTKIKCPSMGDGFAFTICRIDFDLPSMAWFQVCKELHMWIWIEQKAMTDSKLGERTHIC